MPAIGLHPNNVDTAYLDKFDTIRSGTRVEFLFDHGTEFNDMFNENRIECTVDSVSRTSSILNLEMSYASHSIELRVRVMESGSTMVDLKIDGQYGGYPMELSF